MEPRDASRPLTDLELLTIEAEMSMDDRGRLAGNCGVQISVARDGQLLCIGSEVPDTLVPVLIDAFERSARAPAPDQEPPALAACRTILEPACSPLSSHASLYYVIDPHVRAETPAPVVRSDGPSIERLRHRNPGNWRPESWDQLLDGARGPWAMALVNERVVSICHTPRPLTERAAECGVWTHPDHRGRGYAAAVTATWADILRPSGRILFYSTNSQNRSSQRVTARLGLRHIGWTWNLARSERRAQPHPRNRRSS
jgi:RimJ/RimL family protein N-acetyltransferase